MSTRTRALASTLVLLAVAAGAVLFAWFGIERKDEANRTAKASEAKLYAFAPSDVTSVTVEAKGDVTRLVRAGDAWRVEAPIRAEGERAAVDALVDRIAMLSRTSAVAGSADAEALARYGLTKPRARVTVALKSGATETLTLGDENSFDGTAFVRTTSGAVALVPGDLKWAVERSTFDLREKRLLPFDEDEIERVEVTAPALTYALARDGTRGWRVAAPVQDPGDLTVAERVIGAIRGLRAISFEPSRAGDAPGAPRWRVALIAKDGKRRTLAIFPVETQAGSAPASLRARLEGSSETATLTPEATKDLDQDLFALRDKSVLHFDREQVASLRFERGGAQFEVRRDAAPSKMAGYLWTLSSLRAKAFVDESGTRISEHGLDSPALKVALMGADGKKLAILAVSSPRSGRTFATGGQPAAKGARIVEVDPAALEELPRSAQDAAEAPPATATAAKASPK